MSLPSGFTSSGALDRTAALTGLAACPSAFVMAIIVSFIFRCPKFLAADHNTILLQAALWCLSGQERPVVFWLFPARLRGDALPCNNTGHRHSGAQTLDCCVQYCQVLRVLRKTNQRDVQLLSNDQSGFSYFFSPEFPYFARTCDRVVALTGLAACHSAI